MPASEALPLAVRRLVGASLRVLVRADEAAVRGGEITQRLRSTASAVPGRLPIPAPRRGYDDL